jgi:replicative DNA helicase
MLSALEKIPTPKEAANWGNPIEFMKHGLPPFPLEALPSWLGRVSEELAIFTQTPLDLPALVALSVVSLACAKRLRIEVRTGYSEPANLYLAVAMEPGNRKSSVFSTLTAPVEEFEREKVEETQDSVAKKLSEERILASALKHKEKQAAEATDQAERDECSDEAQHLAVELEELRRKLPVSPRFITDDATPEKLASLLKEQGGRVAILSAEGGVFDMMAGRYNQGISNLDVYLKGHAGDVLRVDRQSRAPEFVQEPSLTIGVTIQPEVLRGLFEKKEFRGKGLLARFLYSIPQSLLGRRLVSPPEVTQETSALYRQKIKGLLSLPLSSSETPLVKLSTSARTALWQFQEEIEPQLSQDGELATIQDWAGKIVGAVVRLAGLLHAADLSPLLPWESPISETTMENAITLGRYFIAHAQAAFAEMGADPLVEDAKRALRWIEKNGQETFTKRTAFEGLKGKYKRVTDLDPILELLTQHEFIRPKEAPTKEGPGRRPSQVYEVNPNFKGLSHYSHYSHNPPPKKVQSELPSQTANNANCAISNPNLETSALPVSEVSSARKLAEETRPTLAHKKDWEIKSLTNRVVGRIEGGDNPNTAWAIEIQCDQESAEAPI